MAKNCIQKVIVHNAENINRQVIAEKVGELHVQVIKRILNETALTKSQKIEVIEKIKGKLSQFTEGF